MQENLLGEGHKLQKDSFLDHDKATIIIIVATWNDDCSAVNVNNMARRHGQHIHAHI